MGQMKRRVKDGPCKENSLNQEARGKLCRKRPGGGWGAKRVAGDKPRAGDGTFRVAQTAKTGNCMGDPGTPSVRPHFTGGKDPVQPLGRTNTVFI